MRGDVHVRSPDLEPGRHVPRDRRMQQRPTVLFVTHSIEEAVQLSSRVAVITPRPGRIDRIIPVDLPYPRDIDVKNSPEFTAHVREIQEIFRGFGVI